MTLRLQARGGNAADQAQAAKADTFALLKHDIIEHVKLRYLLIVKAIVFPPIRVCRHKASFAACVDLDCPVRRNTSCPHARPSLSPSTT